VETKVWVEFIPAPERLIFLKTYGSVNHIIGGSTFKQFSGFTTGNAGSET